MTAAEVTLPREPASVPTARRFIESLLLGWGLDGLSWDAAMIVSELATNATLHAGGESFRVRALARPDGSVRLEVTDGSARVPQQRGRSATSTTGRGLTIVGDLSRDWGVEPAGTGKVVWVELGRASEQQQPQEGDAAEVDVEALLAQFDTDDEAGDSSRAHAARAPQAELHMRVGRCSMPAAA